MNKTLGIIGGGQLAMMIIHAASQYGIRSIVLDPNPNCSASSTAYKNIIGNFDNESKIQELFEQSDIVTYEFENINTKILYKINKKYRKCIQTEYPLFISQSRFIEKTYVRNLGINTANFFLIENLFQLHEYIQNSPKNVDYILKTNRMGYDGYNQVVINSKNYLNQLEIISKMFDISSLILEKKINFKKEISVISIFDGKKIHICSVNENTHIKGVLIMSKLYLSKDSIRNKAIKYSKIIAKNINKIGIYSIEYFVTEDDEVIFNEIAPRVHNSGHHTIENLNQSQFDLLIKVLFKIPIKKQKVINDYVLINILGEKYDIYKNKLIKRVLHDLEEKWDTLF